MTDRKRGFDDKELAKKAGQKSSKKGKMHKATVIKMNLGEHLEDFDNSLYENLNLMLKPAEPTTSTSTREKIQRIVGKKLDDKTYDDLVATITNTVRHQVVNDIETKKFVVKELLKYRVPQKKEITAEMNSNVRIVFDNIKDDDDK